ncbi:hypothetical protein JW949_02615 [Candidatus Woesearchaeota archaeon]|nr:hypothetical protein [Candidatus Woesearchaeota archaeon]
MTKSEILEEEPLDMKSTLKELKIIEKRDKELTFRGEKTYNYLKSFKFPSDKDIKEMYEDIEKLNIARLKPVHINKIIDIMPKTIEDLKIVMKGYSLTIDNEGMEKIIKVVKKFK